MIFTLSFTAGFENLEARQAPDAATADRYINALPEDRTAFIFDTDAPDWLGAQLYERYNRAELAALFNLVRDPSVPPVNKFEDKPTAMRRLAGQLVAHVKATKPISFRRGKDHNSVGTSKESHMSETKRARYADTQIITVVAEANPKREGSAAHDRFALYRSGMTVADFKTAGGNAADLAYDVKHGHISLG